ncbi:MAG: hypothetical protein WCR72_15940 [Bacteroidota bacterium]
MNNNFIKNILTDLKVELMDEFDRNFERKAFFDQPWPEVSIANKRGSLLMRSGALRRSLRAQVSNSSIHFSSSMSYARIQNDGGTIQVTSKMKKYFWAMFYKSAPKSRSGKSVKVSAEASYWKAMALKRVGDKVTIRSRRFIGHHPQVDVAVRHVIEDNFKEIDLYIKSHLKR